MKYSHSSSALKHNFEVRVHFLLLLHCSKEGNILLFYFTAGLVMEYFLCSIAAFTRVKDVNTSSMTL